jgi:hypothetical protein
MPRVGFEPSRDYSQRILSSLSDLLSPRSTVHYYFSEGLAAVVVDEKLGFIDKTGEMKIPPRFEPRRGRHGERFGSSFSEGLAPVSTEMINRFQGTYGYINKKGEFVIKPQFQTAQAFF